jgi:parallel beta-helix repeat protein
MKKKTFTEIIIATIIIISQVWAFKTQKVKSLPDTLIVPSSDYPTIQEAINKANPGDTIFIKEGTYFENIVVNKSVSIVGEKVNTTIIDGQSLGDVMKVIASNTSIINVTIQNSEKAYTYSGVFLNKVENLTIQNCILRSNNVGILLFETNKSTFSDNIVMNSGWGLYSKSGSNFNLFVSNTILNNSIGILLDSSSYNKFYRNNFINNTLYQAQVLGGVSNQWDNGVEGNYWSDYAGTDENGDGIGDTELPIWSDYKPLVEPWSRIRIFDDIVVECNFTVASFQINQTVGELCFHVTGPPDWIGFFKVIIPKDLLNANLHEWRVFLENQYVQNITENVYISENDTHTFIYFEGTIAGNTVRIIPEFQPLIILLFTIILVIVAITTRKIKLGTIRKPEKRGNTNTLNLNVRLLKYSPGDSFENLRYFMGNFTSNLDFVKH